MIYYLSFLQILELHRQVIEKSGGASGIRELNLLKSAIAQPMMTFGGNELYPSLPEKASALGFSLIMNHPFIDGNKRIGHAAMDLFLVLNGQEIVAPVDEQERIILAVASGQWDRDALLHWLKDHIETQS